MKLSKGQRWKAYREFQQEQAASIRKAEKKEVAKDGLVNTTSFWQKQQFGPASDVKRLDPLTGEVIEVIRQHDK
jgi:hypothetical protein